MDVSRIPAAIDGLLALCTTAAKPGGPLHRVHVYDGPPVTDLADHRMLFIGDTPDNLESVAGTQTFADLGAGQRAETFAITCTAVARSGDTTMKARRDSAYAIMAAVERLLRPGEPGADITLGGAVLWAHVSGDIALSQLQYAKGSLAKLTFAVTCRARLT
ncbi:hypothetical protein JOF56_005714 [Kibdelosporangium banguiense]|uniref:Uncharacterized protein n=1 Tax=Kibdelosporangium banguiense TaxID=1365924 RepID=A0ABS4TMV8_9PSEU|nr:hypothetical protein [Kibdelosporangium banguiense]MBP2325329.1 hypothetical protein [Kibdelosporangium banguiense]